MGTALTGGEAGELNTGGGGGGGRDRLSKMLRRGEVRRLFHISELVHRSLLFDYLICIPEYL